MEIVESIKLVDSQGKVTPPSLTPPVIKKGDTDAAANRISIACANKVIRTPMIIACSPPPLKRK